MTILSMMHKDVPINAPIDLAPLLNCLATLLQDQTPMRLLFEIGERRIELTSNVVAVEAKQPLVLTPFQEDILNALNGKALRADALGVKVGDRARLYRRPGGLHELREAGLVDLHPRLGYYRPDAPPPELCDEATPSRNWASGSEPKFFPELRSIYWPGLGQYVFGEKQTSVIEALWKARETGLPGVREKDLLDEAGSAGTRLIDLFRHCPAWGRLIIRGQASGTFSLPQ